MGATHTENTVTEGNASQGKELTSAQIFALLDAEYDRDPSQFCGPFKEPEGEYFALLDAEYERDPSQFHGPFKDPFC
jgi:hypothetical protein